MKKELLGLTDKQYHTILREYRNYIDNCVLDNKEKEERIIPIEFEEYLELKLISQPI